MAGSSDPRRTSRQTTLRTVATVAGVGIHTGAQARVRVCPAAPGSGVAFATAGSRVPARAELVVDARRSTTLGQGEARVATVEHVLSALYGLGIDNALIEIDGPELPILDGSALPWVDALQAAGIEHTDEQARVLALAEPVVWGEGGSWYIARPAATLTLTCVTDFDHPLLGQQVVTSAFDPERYAACVAPARTFGFAAEVEALLAAGLALGGTLENALVVYDDHFSQPPRVPDECAAHKLLDLWGDLSLVDGRMVADITAIKPGHRTNTSFARLLAQRMTV